MLNKVQVVYLEAAFGPAAHECIARSQPDAVPPGEWMVLLFTYKPLNATSSLVRISRNGTIIASAVCSVILPDAYADFDIGSVQSHAALRGDMGAVFVVDRFLSVHEAMMMIRKQEEVLGFDRVLSEQQVSLEFLPFQHKSAILSVNASRALASSDGLSLRATVVYLSLFGNYSCVFSTVSGHLELSPATVVDTSTLDCFLPHWPHPAGSVLFKISTDDPTSVRVSGAFPFEIEHSWARPLVVAFDAAGGTRVMVEGAGLRSGEGYSLKWSRRNETEVLHSACRVENASHLSCAVPAWGLVYSAETVDSNNSVAVTLYWYESKVPRSGSKPACASESCFVDFFESVNVEKIQASGQSLTGPAGGGWSVIFLGAGFAPHIRYRMNLTSLFSHDSMLSAVCSVLSVESLNCTMPYWIFEAAHVNAKILTSLPNARRVLHGQGQGPIILQLRVNWIGISMTSINDVTFSAKHGGKLTVAGAGFSQANTSFESGYTCLFQSAHAKENAVTTRSRATVISPMSLECDVPPWRHAFGEARLSIYQMRGMCHGMVECYGSCDCEPQGLGQTAGTLSDGYGNYGDNLECEWIISSECSAIMLSVNVNSESCCDYVHVEDHKYGAELGRLSGSKQGVYTASSGQMRVRFTSDISNPAASSYSGFVANWELSVLPTSPDLMTMIPIYGKNSSVIFQQGLETVTIRQLSHLQYNLSLAGFGFVPGSQDYSCHFIRGAASGLASGGYAAGEAEQGVARMATPAVALSHTEVECLTPTWIEWGSKFSASGAVAVALQFGSDGSPGSTLLVCEASDCWIDLLSQASAIFPSASFAGETAASPRVITVSGYGFEATDSNYRLEFASGDNVVRSSLPSRVSLTEIVFEIPTWSFAAGSTAVRLLNSTQVSAFSFDFRSHWQTVALDADSVGTGSEIALPASGGSGYLLITGFGFEDASCDDIQDWYDSEGDDCQTYVNGNWCVDGGYGPGWESDWGTFADWAADGVDAGLACCACKPDDISYASVFVGEENQVVQSACEALNHTMLSCAAPSWPYIYGKANFSVHEFSGVNGSSSSNLVPNTGTNVSRVRFTQGFDGILPHLGSLNGSLSGPASGSSPVIVSGYGLNKSGRYGCSFWRQGCKNLARACGPDCSSPCTAAQSSFNDEIPSIAAIDGDLSNLYATFHTQCNQANQWWSIDLGQHVSIESVKIYNRLDVDLHRISGSEIRVGDSDDFDQNPACQTNLTGSAVVDVPCLASGRYLFVVQPRADTCLHFAEIEILPLQNASVDVLTSDAVPLSHRALLCHTPVWGMHFAHGMVSLSVEYADDGGYVSTIPCNNATTSCTYLFYEVVSGLTPVQGLAAVVGNTTITVQGYGFWRYSNYTLRFSAGGFNVSTPLLGFVSSTEITFEKPVWEHAATTTSVELESVTEPGSGGGQESTTTPPPLPSATVTCSGTCPCPASSASASGTISDGPGEYSNDANCRWLISSAAGQEVSVSFPFFHTQSGYDYVYIKECQDSSCGSPTLIAQIDGNEVDPSADYVSTTGHLQLVFTTDDSVTHSGFVAEWRVS